MSLQFVLIFVVTCASYYWLVTAQSHTNFWVEQFVVCETNGPVKFQAKVTTEGHNQYCDFNLTSPIPLDGNIAITTFIESMIASKTFMPLFTINETNFCKAFNKYMGEFWYDIERAAQLAPGVCPIAPGRYHVHHLLLNFRKMTLQTFPFGTLRLTVKGIHKRNKQIVFCIMLVVDNRAA